MNEAKKETQRIKTYRALVEAGPRGITNGYFAYKLRLPCTYRTRVSELREEMAVKFGPHHDGDWIPGEEVGRDDDGTIWRWHILIPHGANPRDPLGLLKENRQAAKKRVDVPTAIAFNQGEQPSLF